MKKLTTLILLSFSILFANAQYTAAPCGTTMLISSGTYAIDGDDDFSNSITLPFSFNFYGTLYSELSISTNGFVSFMPTDQGCCSGYNLPYSASQPYISLAHTDTYSYSFMPGDEGSIFYATVGSAPNRVFVIHYQSVSECCGGNSDVTGEIQLYETTNEIKIVVGSINLPTRFVTMGIAKGDDLESTTIAGRQEAPLVANNECWSLVNNFTLPLTLLNFSGNAAESGNLLTWTTAGEVNTRLFEIQRSDDGRNFSAINSVPASTNNAGSKEYTFSDANGLAYKPVLYYRLKMIDQDNRFTYSPIVRLSKEQHNTVSTYPNPFTDKLIVNLDVNQKDNATITFRNINGAEVFKQSLQVKQGVNAVEMNIPSTVLKGIYLLEVKTSSRVETVKVVKL